jgi:glycosyltransferase involved in cell wall biosynthesis
VVPSTPDAEEPTILFLGTYEYPPNVDAAVYLVEEIWPFILRRVPAARLVLAGAYPERLPGSIRSQDGVECPGFIKDLEVLYRRIQIVACPIRIGAGMRIKILEASSYGKPVVATQVAAEGIELAPGKEISLEDDPRAFARACVELLADPARRRQMGEQARARVAQLYDRSTIVRKIAGEIRAAAASASTTMAPDVRQEGKGRRFVFIGGTTEPGGLHVHTADVARSLASAGQHVTILSTSHDFYSPLVSGTSVNVLRLDLDENGPGLRHFRVWWKALAPFRGAQGVFCRGSGGEGSLAVLLAMWARLSSVYTIEHSLPEFRESLDRRRPAWRDALAGRLIQRAIAVSESVRRAMIDTFRFPPERIKTCVNWVDADRFKPDPASRVATRAELGVDEDCFVIGCVGRLGPEKRIDLLIREFSRFRGAYAGKTKLVVVGGGWKEAELRAQVEALDLAEDVVFTGRVENAARWYCAFDLYVLASLYEGFPLTLLEAMACAVPSLSLRIGGDAGGPAQCIRSGESGFLIPPDDPDVRLREWLAKIAELDASERQRIGCAARKRVMQNFSIARRLPDVLEQLDAEDVAERFRAEATTANDAGRDERAPGG